MLDMGGVLTQEHRLEKVDELMRILGLSGAREDFLATYFAERQDYDRGTADCAEYWRRVARVSGAELHEDDIPTLVRVDLESWFNMRPSMLEFIEAAKAKVARLVLLSNLHPDGARYIREGPGRAWAETFDELVISCEHQLLKPEREIYELALGSAGVRSDETLFVDDSPGNVEGARAAGLRSFRFLNEEHFAATLAAEYELVL
jgi:HAD superfamily hydrolase (TIGR01509 family)